MVVGYATCMHRIVYGWLFFYLGNLMLYDIGLGVATFIVTNVDDLLILTLYFSSPLYKVRAVVLGQYLGICSLIAMSLVGFLAGMIVAPHWVSLLGILPLILGIRALALEREKNEGGDISSAHTKFQFLNVAFVTIANGGDNIGVYIPLFANADFYQVVVYCVIFLILTALWCLLGFYFVKHPLVERAISKGGNRILPVFLIFLGLFILRDFVTWLI